MVSQGGGPSDAETGTNPSKEQTDTSLFDAHGWLVSCWPASANLNGMGAAIETEERNDGGINGGIHSVQGPAEGDSTAQALPEDEVREDSLGEVQKPASTTGDQTGGPPVSGLDDSTEKERPKSAGETSDTKCKINGGSMSVPLKQLKKALNRKVRGPMPSEMEMQRKEHMASLKCAIRSHGRYDTKVADVLVNVADFYQQALSDPKQARNLQGEALAIYSARLGDYDPRCIETKLRIAQSHAHVRGGGDDCELDLDEATEVLCHAMNARSALLGESDPSVLDVRRRLADVLRRAGRTREAVREAKRALKGYREEHGDEHPRVCSVVEDIAGLYSQLGEHDKANGILAEVVKLRIAIDGNDHRNVADALMNWAWSFDAMGNVPKAMKIMKQAYGSHLEREGELGASVLRALDAIGKLYSKMSQYDKAIKAHTRVLTVKKQTLGNDNLETAASYVAVGCALREVGETQRAAKCMKRASDIYEKKANSEQDVSVDAALLDSIHQVGLTFQLSGEYEESLEAFSREIALRRKEGGKQHMHSIAEVLNAMGLVHCKRGSMDEALDCYKKALAMMEELEGRKLKFAETLSNAGLALEQAGRIDDACQAYAEAVLIFRSDGIEKGHEAVDQILEKLRANGNYQIYIDATSKRLPCSLLDSGSST